MKRILSLARASTVLTFLAMSISSFAQGPCGGDSQRSCCTLHGEFATDGVASLGLCNSGMSYSPENGCNANNAEGGCTCSDGSNKSTGVCYKPQPCGGAGQRACCNSDFEFASNGLACGDGLVQIAGSSSSADPWNWVCGAVSGGFGYASGICVQPASCGGLGQRACCTGTREYAQKSERHEQRLDLQ